MSRMIIASSICNAMKAIIGEKSKGKLGLGGIKRRNRPKIGSVTSYTKRVKKLSLILIQEKITRIKIRK